MTTHIQVIIAIQTLWNTAVIIVCPFDLGKGFSKYHTHLSPNWLLFPAHAGGQKAINLPVVAICVSSEFHFHNDQQHALVRKKNMWKKKACANVPKGTDSVSYLCDVEQRECSIKLSGAKIPQSLGH